MCPEKRIKIFQPSGFTECLHGDILLTGPELFDPKKVGEAQVQCFLYILDQSITKPAGIMGITPSPSSAMRDECSSR